MDEPIIPHKRFSGLFFMVFTLIGFAAGVCLISAGAVVSAAVLKAALESRTSSAARALAEASDKPEIKMFSFIASFNPSMNVVEERLREIKTAVPSAAYAILEDHRGIAVASAVFEGKPRSVPFGEMPVMTTDSGRPVLTLAQPISNVFGEEVGRVVAGVDMAALFRVDMKAVGRFCRYTFAANDDADIYVASLSLKPHPLGLIARQKIDVSRGRSFSAVIVVQYHLLGAVAAAVLIAAFLFGGIIEGVRSALYRPPVHLEHVRHHRAAWEEREKEEFISSLIDIKSTMLSVRKRLSDMKHAVHGAKASVIEKAMTIDAKEYLTGGKTAIIGSADDERELAQNDAYDESDYETLDIARYDALSKSVRKEKTGAEGKTELSTDGGPREIVHVHDAADYVRITLPT